MFFWLIFYLIIAAYSLVIAAAAVGWRILPKQGSFQLDNRKTFFSIIIPFRNEEQNLEGLLQSISNFRYNTDCYEVVFIDDHSDDKGLNIVKAFAVINKNIRAFKLSDSMHGKKEALDMGIQKAKGEVCLLTDADCIPGPDWLNSYNRFYRTNHKPSMIIGLVDFLPGQTPLQQIFRLEFLSLIITGAGFASLNKPIYCNSANLAIKKSDYPGIKQMKREIPTGDDVFLLHELSRMKKSIKVLKSDESIVYTKPPKSLKEFLNQRIRWGSKAKNYNTFWPVILSIIVFLTSGILLSGFVYGLLSKGVNFFLLGMGIKIFVDGILFLSGSGFFKFNHLLWLILPIELFYPFYILIAGLAGIKKPFEWKGR
jgi:cellulose synthase/poly-beta-1,6-N-acetylglucosamine synthase-like glycosyltransferase